MIERSNEFFKSSWYKEGGTFAKHYDYLDIFKINFPKNFVSCHYDFFFSGSFT